MRSYDSRGPEYPGRVLIPGWRRQAQLEFLLGIIKSYNLELRRYHWFGDVEVLDIENDMYENIRLLGNDGYLPTDIVELANRLQRDARPTRGIYRLLQFAYQVITGSDLNICFHNNRICDKMDANDRINGLDRKVLDERNKARYNALVDMKKHCQPDRGQNDNANSLKILLDWAERNMKSSQGKESPPSDSATTRKEAEELRKRLQAYKREDAKRLGAESERKAHRH
ncbi:uncharacterized protein EAE97_007020 [Botrytis byssoidea]|uniref:Uncharacterized protein n=1 Tax=Botrytis byssoidea TaxID=139641 RepID=A0A9P5INW0_9HELO|nr:uncharacterized protein EAE97_007020 [Botrytis byssoidea]KAF7940834.1 hypothetical protein EAE97_007020 [Botrytis byssoidea]